MCICHQRALHDPNRVVPACATVLKAARQTGRSVPLRFLPSPPPQKNACLQLGQRAKQALAEGQARVVQTGEDLAADMEQAAKEGDVSAAACRPACLPACLSAPARS
jgi:hypothetical protein